MIAVKGADEATVMIVLPASGHPRSLFTAFSWPIADTKAGLTARAQRKSAIATLKMVLATIVLIHFSRNAQAQTRMHSVTKAGAAQFAFALEMKAWSVTTMITGAESASINRSEVVMVADLVLRIAPTPSRPL